MIHLTSKKFFRSVLSLSLIFGIILSTNQSFTHLASVYEPTLLSDEQPLQTVAYPSPSVTQTKVYVPLIYKVEGLPPVELLSARAENAKGTTQSAFLPGDEIHYVSQIINRTGSNVSVDLKWFQSSPCEQGWIYDQIVELGAGESKHIVPSKTPSCLGVYTNTVIVNYRGFSYSIDLEFLNTLPSQITIGSGQGFDKCYVPTVEQMQTWWSTSPYKVINLYIGGISLYCPDSRIEPIWLYEVSQQGWSFIPTWVGPQAACTTYKHRMSPDPIKAYLEGRNEAEAATAKLRKIGFLGDSVVYYDLESYSGADQACRQASAAFLRGWVERLHELNVRAGAYGAPCSSYMLDWTTIDPPPDDVWIAHWYTDHYDPKATVWDAPCLSNNYWAYSQRLKQYTGGHNETWGGLKFNIDSDVLDGGLVALPMDPTKTTIESNPLQSAPSPNYEANAVIHDMQRMTAEQGWLWQGEHLLWTRDGGKSWQDRSPVSNTPSQILATSFVDAQNGLLLRRVFPENGQTILEMLRTQDGGAGWERIDTNLANIEANGPITSGFFDLPDQIHGWLVLKLQTSSNFSQGRLFYTADSGYTWEERSLPLGEPVKFIDEQRGWVAGGPAGDQLYQTTDGGETWNPVVLPLSSQSSETRLVIGLPQFSSVGDGFLPAISTNGSGTQLMVYRSRDQGMTWQMDKIYTSGNADTVNNPILFSLDESGDWWLSMDTPDLRSSRLTQPIEIKLQSDASNIPALFSLDFISAQSGWMVTQSGICEGTKLPAWQSSAAGVDNFHCTSKWQLMSTNDGGKSWSDITPLE